MMVSTLAMMCILCLKCTQCIQSRRDACPFSLRLPLNMRS